MKNAEVWASYREYTSELTKHARQVAFGGVTVCWLFRNALGLMSAYTLIALALLILFFLIDALQYLVGAVSLRTWVRREEIKRYDATQSIEGDYDMPESVDCWPYRLFRLKIVTLVTAFVALGVEVARQVTGRF